VVDELLGMFDRKCDRFLVLGSPPATGKTSLLLLIADILEMDAQNQVELFVANPTDTPGTVLKRFHQETGIDLADQSATQSRLNQKLGDSRTLWLLLDDAQYLYGNASSFWFPLVKHSQLWMPKNARCIIATTYSQSVGDSPAALKTLLHYPRDRSRCVTSVTEDMTDDDLSADDLARERLALTEKEMESLWDLKSKNQMWSQWHSVKQALISLSGGHVGVMATGILFITLQLTKEPKGAKVESEVFAKLHGKEFSHFLERPFCEPFLFDVSERDEISKLMLCSLRGDEVDITISRKAGDERQESTLFKLWKCGVLTTSATFTSPAARFFYYARLFPGRGPVLEYPRNLDDLVLACVKSLSMNSLQQARDGENFPKEGAFQQLFYQALCMALPAAIFIVSEMSTYVQDETTGDVQTGEINFFVNGNLNYKIELLREGKGIGEHLARFDTRTGKYRGLPRSSDATSILVIDLRGPRRKTPCDKDDIRCTVYFSDNFSSCEIQMRREEEITKVTLRP